MENDQTRRIESLEKRLIETEQLARASANLLDKLVKGHNDLFEAHVRLLESYNEGSGYVGGVLADFEAQINMLIDRVAPEQRRFQSQVDRIFNRKKDDR